MTNTVCTDTSMTRDWQISFGMPSSARVRVTALRGLLPVTTGVDIETSVHTCALIQDLAVDRSAMTDAPVKGAFPGTSAWSPPI